jgi:hypothetical protein
LWPRARRTELHFVRCIKPNNDQAQEDYDAALVLHQLRCCGITEVARIARAGYPTRYAHAQFAQRYSALLGNKLPRARPLAHCMPEACMPCSPTVWLKSAGMLYLAHLSTPTPWSGAICAPLLTAGE